MSWSDMWFIVSVVLFFGSAAGLIFITRQFLAAKAPAGRQLAESGELGRDFDAAVEEAINTEEKFSDIEDEELETQAAASSRESANKESPAVAYIRGLQQDIHGFREEIRGLKTNVDELTKQVKVLSEKARLGGKKSDFPSPGFPNPF